MVDLSVSERATLNFYQWEYLGRGYYHFATPVDIEPPYVPFHSIGKRSPSTAIDDGRVPNVFKQVLALLNPPKVETETEELEVIPRYLEVEEVPTLQAVIISFPKGFEVRHSVMVEFLNILSFTDHPISFEIQASFEKLQIRFVGSTRDIEVIEMQLHAFFPEALIKKIDADRYPFNGHGEVAITDLGLDEEFMRPIHTVDNYTVDPLTSIIACMEHLLDGETMLFQILFRGVSAPWSRDITRAVSDGKGGSFFVDAPEMPNCAKEKTEQPLFSVVMRVAAQGFSDVRSAHLVTQLSRNITGATTSRFNKLIPLSNEGYQYDYHFYNVLHRTSNRIGFILNTKELATLVHYPNHTVVSELLHVESGKTRRVPKVLVDQKYELGTNTHRGITNMVGISDEHKLRHCHIIGSTGVGKSTLIANMVIQDMELGNGLFLFDPHGDIVEDVIARVPEHRRDDVIIFDPYDTEYPIGFNLLHASTDAERIVLSSDLVGIFKRFATSWGDNMSSVLAQAVNAFLESDRGGTLIELKRFLLEDRFREEFLKTIDDPSVHYYWENEYGYLKNRISPLLTRIDTFLRPKVVRYMLVQRSGIDFKECIENKKVVLFKLSQGLIGEENSYLLGSLFLSKINQVALGRQSMTKAERHPFYVYLDEFQNFITPSISSILSGARKYGLGLVLAHQDLNQISDYQVINSVLSNPNIRICFKVGDADAQRLQGGFAHFEGSDLQSLGVGQAIVRVGSSSDDFNLNTEPPQDANVDTHVLRDHIVLRTRQLYCRPKDELDQLLEKLLPKKRIGKEKADKKGQQEIVSIPESKSDKKTTEEKVDLPERTSVVEKEKKQFIKQAKEQERLRKHRSLQYFVRTLGTQRGLKATLEKEAADGGKIDVVLEGGKVSIAIEVAVTNTVEYELGNIQKCIESGYKHVVMLSEDQRHLQKIASAFKEKKNVEVHFIQPDGLADLLDKLVPKAVHKEERFRGYRIKTSYVDKDEAPRKNSITDILIRSLRKKR